jgi:hypothetical protein
LVHGIAKRARVFLEPVLRFERLLRPPDGCIAMDDEARVFARLAIDVGVESLLGMAIAVR